MSVVSLKASLGKPQLFDLGHSDAVSALMQLSMVGIPKLLHSSYAFSVHRSSTTLSPTEGSLFLGLGQCCTLAFSKTCYE